MDQATAGGRPTDGGSTREGHGVPTAPDQPWGRDQVARPIRRGDFDRVAPPPHP